MEDVLVSRAVDNPRDDHREERDAEEKAPAEGNGPDDEWYYNDRGERAGGQRRPGRHLNVNIRGQCDGAQRAQANREGSGGQQDGEHREAEHGEGDYADDDVRDGEVAQVVDGAHLVRRVGSRHLRANAGLGDDPGRARLLEDDCGDRGHRDREADKRPRDRAVMPVLGKAAQAKTCWEAVEEKEHRRLVGEEVARLALDEGADSVDEPAHQCGGRAHPGQRLPSEEEAAHRDDPPEQLGIGHLRAVQDDPRQRGEQQADEQEYPYASESHELPFAPILVSSARRIRSLYRTAVDSLSAFMCRGKSVILCSRSSATRSSHSSVASFTNTSGRPSCWTIRARESEPMTADGLPRLASAKQPWTRLRIPQRARL